jgi:hypothetical protein
LLWVCVLCDICCHRLYVFYVFLFEFLAWWGREWRAKHALDLYLSWPYRLLCVNWYHIQAKSGFCKTTVDLQYFDFTYIKYGVEFIPRSGIYWFSSNKKPSSIPRGVYKYINCKNTW